MSGQASRGAALFLVAAVVALAGCETTQDLSAKRAREAPPVASAATLVRLGRTAPGVRVADPVLLRGSEASAVAVELRNTSRRTLVDVPVGVRVTTGSTSAYTNRTPGLQRTLLRIPVLGPGEHVVWVNDQLPVVSAGARVKAAGGAAKAVSADSVPRLRVERLRPAVETGRPVAEGTVRNLGEVVQDDLTVFVVARRGGRIVAAGAGRVPRLKARGTSTFVAFLIGDPRGARLRAVAPPTTLKERASR